jgi:hypothetical protein
LQAQTWRKGGAVELLHRHKGAHHLLVPEGAGAWRYYMLTRNQLRFWRGLSRAERNYLVRLGRRGCFVCVLRGMMERQERFEATLYRAMMGFLLQPDRRTKSS